MKWVIYLVAHRCLTSFCFDTVGWEAWRESHLRLSPKILCWGSPFPQIDITGAVMIVWRVRGKTIRSVLCSIMCNNCAQCSAHIWTDLTVLWIRFCLTGPISPCLDSFLCMCVFCSLPYIICFSFVTWWGGPGGIETWSLGPLYPSVLIWHCWLGHFTHKNPSPIWPIMCLVGR